MVTINQLIYKIKRKKKKKKCLLKALNNCPQKLGIVEKAYIEKPKKPNSARRKCLKVKLKENGKIIRCHVPGEKHNITKHGVVLIRGGRAQDLIGIRYKSIRGKFDCLPVENRKTRRSKYGIKHPDYFNREKKKKKNR